MIGSHDTFTYLEPTCELYGLATRWWRTQCKTIEEQYAFGVRFFDIRVCLSYGKWKLCHGLATLNKSFFSIRYICDYMNDKFPDAIYRIVLERGNKDKETFFINSIVKLCALYPNLWRIDIKSTKQWNGLIDNNNQSLFDRGYKFALVNTWESPSYEKHGYINNLSDVIHKDLRKEAKMINSELPFFNDKTMLDYMIKTKEQLYFLDYCTNEY